MDGIPCQLSYLSSGTAKFNFPAVHTANAISDANNSTVAGENPSFPYIVDNSSFSEIHMLKGARAS